MLIFLVDITCKLKVLHQHLKVIQCPTRNMKSKKKHLSKEGSNQILQKVRGQSYLENIYSTLMAQKYLYFTKNKLNYFEENEG